MFKDALREIVEKTEGALAGLVMDGEGITLEKYTPVGSSFDIDTIGIEFGVVLGAIKRAATSLEAGETREVAIGTSKVMTLIRPLNETYFLALTLSPEGNMGKGRYLMRTAAPRLLAELT